MNQTIQLYKEFIKRCTDSKNSVENYSDFKRLNDLIKSCIDSNFNGLETCTVSDADKLQTIYDQLLTFQSFELFKDNKSNKDKDFVHIGGGQYHNTLKTFIRFLNAMQLFSANSDSPSFTKKPSTNILPLQQIFYGAPGTGKSHGIKEKEGDFSKVIRTTFHPDSDYSTFVGAYKPTMASKERIYSADELIGKLTTIKESGISYPCHKFSAQYWESLKDLSAAEIKRIITACGFTDTMTVEVGKGISIGQELASKSDDKKITYTFVKQAFLKAYIEA